MESSGAVKVIYFWSTVTGMQLGTRHPALPAMFCVTKTYQDFGKHSKGGYIEICCFFNLFLRLR